MSMYLKKFETQAAYEAAQPNLILPNVSLTVDNNTVHYNPSTPPTPSHEYVDLGLPSGTKWATMNVGANSITDYGNYYQYGKGTATYQETSGDTVYEGTENPLAASADTAAQVWGGSWHTPTCTQYKELFYNTTNEFVTDYQGSGIDGYLLTSTADTTIKLFFPAANYYNENGDLTDDNSGCYWSSSQTFEPTRDICIMYFDMYEFGIGGWKMDVRNFGCTIRGVLDE